MCKAYSCLAFSPTAEICRLHLFSPPKGQDKVLNFKKVHVLRFLAVTEF